MHSSQGRGLSLIPKDIQSIARGNVRDQIVRQLIELIVAGRFPAGTCLPAERELCQQFNVSRAGVREAVGILASQGFLTVRQGSGTFVNPSQSWNPLDPIVLLAKGRKAALEEVIEARQLLEPLIAALAADRATPEEITALEQYVRLARTVDEDVGMDVAFHSNLARASHNRVLVIMLHSVNELIQEARREACGGRGGVGARVARGRSAFAGRGGCREGRGGGRGGAGATGGGGPRGRTR